MAFAIEIEHVTTRYNGRPILRDFSLQVPEGSVYAFLGRNGSGKTTAIKLLLGLLRAEAGTVKVLDGDPAEASTTVLSSVGYVSEDRALYDWMTGGELIRFTSAFHATWDAELAGDLCRRLHLAEGERVGRMSRGQRGRLALLLALAHRPRLLILDEPTAGLDSVVRRQFLEETAELAADGGRTVFFSTNLIDEVERVADHVGILAGHRLVVEDELAHVKEHFRRVHAYLARDVAEVRPPEGVIGFRRRDHELLFLTDRYDPAMEESLRRQGAERVEAEGMSLDDIFVETTKEEDER